MLEEILRGPKIFKMTKAQVNQMIDDAIASIDKVLPGYIERAERDRPDNFFRMAAETLRLDRARFSEIRAFFVGDGPWEMSYEELARVKNEFAPKATADRAEKLWDEKKSKSGRDALISALTSAMGPS